MGVGALLVGVPYRPCHLGVGALLVGGPTAQDFARDPAALLWQGGGQTVGRQVV